MTTTSLFCQIDVANKNPYTFPKTGSVNLVAGRLYLLFVESRSTSAPADPAVTGQSGSWTNEAANTFYGNASADSRFTVFSYVPGSNENSVTLTLTYSGSRSHCSAALVEVTGQASSTPVAQVGYANADSATATSLAPATASAPASGSTMVGCFIHYAQSENVSPDSNYTELAEDQGSAEGGTSGGDLTTIETEYRAVGQQTCTATWSTASRGCAYNVEVAAASGSTTYTKTVTATGVVQKQAITKTVTLTGTVKRAGITAQVAATAVLGSANLKIVAATGVLQKAGVTKTVTASALLGSAGVKTVSADAVLRKSGVTKTVTVTARIGVAAGGGTVLNDTSKSWGTDAWAGYGVRVTGGTGAGQVRLILSNTATQLTVDPAWDSNPDNTSTYEIFQWVPVLTDYGVAGVDDAFNLEPSAYGLFAFCTFDLASNEQDPFAAVQWVYTSADDTFIGGANQPPVLGIRQLTSAEQGSITGYTDPSRYVVLELSALDPEDGTTGVTIEYKRRGDTDFTTGLPATAAGYPTATAVDNPSGTRTRLVAISRGTDENWMQVRAKDADALYSDLLTYTADYNTIPELSSIDSYLDPFTNEVQVDGAVDDDTHAVRWRLDTGTWTTITGLATKKNFNFSFALVEGTRKVLQVQPGADDPIDTVSISSSTNASPISVTTATAHGYTTGDRVTIADHGVNVAANGAWVITVTGTTTFTLNGSTGAGVGGATGTATRNVGEIYTKEWMRPPRTVAVFENRSPDGGVSKTIVRATFRMYPEPPVTSSGTSSGANTGTTLNDTAQQDWAAHDFQANDAQRKVYYVRIDGGPTAGQLRRIVDNTTTQLTVAPAWDVTPGAVAYSVLAGGTSYSVTPAGSQTGGDFRGVWGSAFISRSVSGDLIEYYSELNGVTKEAVQRAFLDGDSVSAIGILTMVENTANVLNIDIAEVDDDSKSWELYLKKGGWPTLEATETGTPDPLYRRFQGPMSVTSLMTGAGNGTWYALAVPYDSYGDRGVIKTASASVDGTGANEGVLSNLYVTPNDNGTTASYNKLCWDHNSVLNSPDTDWFVRTYAYRGDQGSGSEVEFGYRDSGTASAASSTTLSDSTKGWSTNAYANFWVVIVSGTGAGQYRKISSNTGTQLTVSTSWTTTPDTTSHYEVLSRYPRLDAGTGAGAYDNNDDTDGTSAKGSILHGTSELRGTSADVYRTWYYTVELYQSGTLKRTYYLQHSDYYKRPATQFGSTWADVDVYTGGACVGPDPKGHFYGDPPFTVQVTWDILNGTENDTDYCIQLMRNDSATVRKNISGSATSGGLVKITTSAAHGYSTGNIVSVEGHSVAGYNGTWTITVVDTTSFTLNGSTWTSNGTGGAVVRNSDFYLIWQLSTTTESQLDYPAGSAVYGEAYQSHTIDATYQVRIVRKSDGVVVGRETTVTYETVVGYCTN